MDYAVEERTPTPTNKWIHLILVLIISTLVFVSYINVLQNDFVWDDEFLIRDNSYIRNFSHLKDIFKTYLASSSGNINNFYRPLQEASYMVDYFLWGALPFGFHLSNVILHMLTAVCVYILSFKIVKNSFPAFVTALLFGIHPINTEAVTYVAGRADSLYLLFFTLSFILFLKSQDAPTKAAPLKTGFYIGSIICYAASILSKEIAIIFPLFLLLYAFTFFAKGTIRNRLYYLSVPFWAVSVLYIITRKTVLDFSGVAPSFVMAQFNIFIRIATTFKAICVYLGLLIAPVGLHMERRIAIARPLLEPYSILAAILVIGFFITILRSRRRSRNIFFAGMWFFIGLLPVSNIVPINSFIAEHWLYLPAIGIYMIVGLALSNIFFKDSKLLKGLIVLVLMAMVICYGFLTSQRNKDWKDEIAFFKNTIKYSPKNARLHLNFGNTYSERGEMENALNEYKKVIELAPNFAEAYSNIAAIYLGQGRFGEAKDYLDKALAIKPNFPNALFMRGALYEQEGDSEKAEALYLKALDIMPDFVNCHMRLGDIYLNSNRIDKAVSHWKKVLQINPNNSEARRLIDEYSK